MKISAIVAKIVKKTHKNFHDDISDRGATTLKSECEKMVNVKIKCDIWTDNGIIHPKHMYKWKKNISEE